MSGYPNTGQTALEIGQKVGNFVVERLLGRGAMGEVYLASHETLDRVVAIKVLRTHLAANDSLAQRFIDEAKAVSQIGHAGLVEVYDFGTLPDGQLYSVMEALAGRDLEQTLKEDGPMPAMQACEVVRQAAQTLEVVHEHGIVHRDLKPGNLFLADPGEGEGERRRVYILDFGIAKLFVRPEGSAETAEGTLIGTPEYMAPEQARGGEIDRRTDVYAIGCLLYELLAGVPPFQGKMVTELLLKHVTDTPASIAEKVSNLPDGLASVVMRCLQKKPEDRFKSMEEVARALTAVLGGEAQDVDTGLTSSAATEVWTRTPVPQPRNKRSLVPFLVLGLAGIVGAAFALYIIRTDSRPQSPQPEVVDDDSVDPVQKSNPFSLDDQEALAGGAAIWASKCAKCHGSRGEGDGADTPPGLHPRAFAEMRVEPGVLDVYRHTIIMIGIDDRMPAFADELTELDVWKVVMFILTLSKATGAEPTLADAEAPEFTPELVDEGAALYESRCSSCHGKLGRGNGRAAHYLGRSPADFTSGMYKLRSTPKDSLPLDRDIFRTISRGMGVSGMPSFSSLPERSRWALVAFIKTLNGRFASEDPGEEIQVPEPPNIDDQEASIKRGQAAFHAAGCPKCHGEDGGGDGEMAAELEDARGAFIAPADFTAPSTFIGGMSRRDMYRTMMTGITGTPMPTGSDFFDPDEAWDVISFIRSIGALDN